MKEISFYIHIPFCKSKCLYCAFVSFPQKENCFSPYVQRLKQEILSYKQKLCGYKIKSVFFGGGTPSLLSESQIADITNFIKQNFTLKNDCETTLEANPDSFTKQKAICYKKIGINRLSFGLQSLNDNVLKSLNRPHTKQDFFDALNHAKNAGFLNINADILLGLPHQTIQEVKNNVQTLAKLGLTHISAYGLMVEKNTPLYALVKNKKIILPTEEQSIKLYETTVKELKKHGYNRYEISNFAQKGFECKHNQNYWQRGEFLGFGVGAYSFFEQTHFENTKNLNTYLTKPFKRLNQEKQTKTTAQNEVVMLALRTEKGLNLKEFNKMFGTNFEEVFKCPLSNLQKNGLVKIEKGFLKITNFQVSNYIIQQFFV